MYSSLQSIDIVAKTDAGPAFHQTDHRSTAEMAAELELSVLFALTRILNARAHGDESGTPAAEVRYVCRADPPAEVREALAAAGAVLTLTTDQQPEPLPRSWRTPSELADWAFRGLAARAAHRFGEADALVVLRRLEQQVTAGRAETDDDPDDDPSSDPAHWTAVLEIAAVAGDVVRSRYPGAWVHSASAGVVPFGFRVASGSTLMLTARAARFVGGETPQSLVALLDVLDDLLANKVMGPVLPSLRPRDEVAAVRLVARPLLDDPAAPDVPMVAYGHDTPTAFGVMREDGTVRDLEHLHHEALKNLAGQEVQIQPLEFAGVTLSAVGGNFYAAEKLLDVAFMQTMHRTHGRLLAAMAPCRGHLLVTSALPAEPARAFTVLAAVAERLEKEGARISTAILLVEDGRVVGRVATADAPAPSPAASAKAGFFSRLLGRS